MSDDADVSTFLSRLAETGAAILVAGDVPTDLHVRACHGLLGEEAQRRRVLVLQDTDPAAVDSRLPTGTPTDEDHLRVVGGGRPTRSTTVAATGGSASRNATDGPDASLDAGRSVPTVTPAGDSLGEVGATIATAVESLERAAGGFEPAELRVCVEALGQLHDADDYRGPVTFLHLFKHLVTGKRGIGHVHLPVGSTDPAVDRYGPLFDVVVELRVDDGTPQQRWTATDGPASEWVPL